MTIHAMHFIDGKWSAGDPAVVERANPANRNDIVSTYPIGTQAEAQVAIAAAQQALPNWRRTPAPARGRILRKVAELARARTQDLAGVMVREAGKLRRDAEGEITKGILALEYFDGAGLRPVGSVIPTESAGVFAYTQRFPLGVVAIITPWNFPWAVALWKIAAALVTGNTVVWKPSPLVPAFSAMIAKLFEDADLPRGVFNLVHGYARVGETFVSDPRVNGVSFTGSNPIGRMIYCLAAERGLSHVQCEMGGKNAVVVLPGADLDLAAQATIQGAFGSAGQRCTATSRAIVHRDLAEAFTSKVVAGAQGMLVGPGNAPESQMGPLVSEEHLRRVMDAVADAQTREGLPCVAGGERLTGGELELGYFHQPTVFVRVSVASKLFREEIFGPVLAITSVASYEEAVEAVNAVDFGLAASVFTDDPRILVRFVEEADVGIMHGNEATVGGEAQLPFGGWKATAIGPREMGEEGLAFFTRSKTVFMNHGSGVLPITR